MQAAPRPASRRAERGAKVCARCVEGAVDDVRGRLPGGRRRVVPPRVVRPGEERDDRQPRLRAADVLARRAGRARHRTRRAAGDTRMPCRRLQPTLSTPQRPSHDSDRRQHRGAVFARRRRVAEVRHDERRPPDERVVLERAHLVDRDAAGGGRSPEDVEHAPGAKAGIPVPGDEVRVAGVHDRHCSR